jgi:hypothetical protein
VNINLPTGKTITISCYEYFFALKEEDVDLFFQSCIADDLGSFIENPFCNKSIQIEIEDIDDTD